MDSTTMIGLAAAACTSFSYLPQLKKCWDTGSAGDISLYMYLVLGVGLALWVTYGLIKGDWVLTLANSIGLTLLCGVLFFKLREVFGFAPAKASAGKGNP